jgi:hypothetical protein
MKLVEFVWAAIGNLKIGMEVLKILSPFLIEVSKNFNSPVKELKIKVLEEKISEEVEVKENFK